MKKILSFLIVFTIFLNINTPVTFAKDNAFSQNATVNSTTHMLVDVSSGNILSQTNAYQTISPAATTMLLTALVVLQSTDLNDEVTVSYKAFEDLPDKVSSADLVVGEIITVEELLYAMLVPSGVDAANALAYHVGEGSYSKFTTMMNIMANKIGAYNSNFTNAHGIFDEDQYSTAYDMSVIARYAYKYEVIQDILITAAKRMSATNKHPQERVLYTTNHNVFRSTDPRFYTRSLGGKTGYEATNGSALVSFAKKGGGVLLSVIYECHFVGGENKVFYETKDLFEWGFENYAYQEIFNKSTPILETAVELSAVRDYITLSPAQAIGGFFPTEFDEELKIYLIDAPESTKAPIKKDESLGSVEVFYDGVSFGRTELIAVNDVEVSTVLIYIDIIENFFSSTTFYLLLAMLISIIFVAYFDKRARERRLRRRVTELSRSRRK